MLTEPVQTLNRGKMKSYLANQYVVQTHILLCQPTYAIHMQAYKSVFVSCKQQLFFHIVFNSYFLFFMHVFILQWTCLSFKSVTFYSIKHTKCTRRVELLWQRENCFFFIGRTIETQNVRQAMPRAVFSTVFYKNNICFSRAHGLSIKKRRQDGKLGWKIFQFHVRIETNTKK